MWQSRSRSLTVQDIRQERHPAYPAVAWFYMEAPVHVLLSQYLHIFSVSLTVLLPGFLVAGMLPYFPGPHKYSFWATPMAILHLRTSSYGLQGWILTVFT